MTAGDGQDEAYDKPIEMRQERQTELGISKDQRLRVDTEAQREGNTDPTSGSDSTGY